MYASKAFIASDSGSIFSPWLGFSMHQLIMSRSVANLFILTWNFGNACGWVSEAKGWHIAQAHPVVESTTSICFAVASSPWNKRSPFLTCSMNTSSWACSCCGVTGSLFATAGPTRTAIAVSIPRSDARDTATRNVVLAIIAIPPLVWSDPVGDPRPQDLRLAQRGILRGLGVDLLAAPHDVLGLDPIIVHADAAPADAVVEIAGVCADHRPGQLGHSLRGIGPRPGGRQHADRAHGSDFVIEHLMDVTMDVGDLGIRLQHVIPPPPVTHPEVPRRVVLVERIMAEDDNRPGFVPVGEDLLQPVELVAAHAGPRAGDRSVEGGHVAHSLLGTHLPHRPVVRGAADRVEPDKAHTLVIKSPVGLAE